MSRLVNLLRGWWLWLCLQWTMARRKIAHDRFMMQADITDTIDEASLAMKRVIDRRLFPPDCLSAGAMWGGPALFLRTDKAREVFIGRTYDHAADKLIEWWERERRQGAPPSTASTTTLNRKQRRAWASKNRKDLSAR